MNDLRNKTILITGASCGIIHYQYIAATLIRLMAEIDRVIEAHGGWPGAFRVSAGEAPT